MLVCWYMRICQWRTCTREVIGYSNKIFCSKTCKSKRSVTASRRKAKIRAVNLLGGKCSKCGYNKSVWALQFRHVDRNKEFGLSARGLTRAWSRVLVELRKCILVCANCHAETHAEEFSIKDAARIAAEIPRVVSSWHGTHSGYSYRKCRCVECKKGHAAHVRVCRDRKRNRLLASSANRFDALVC